MFQKILNFNNNFFRNLLADPVSTVIGLALLVAAGAITAFALFGDISVKQLAVIVTVVLLMAAFYFLGTGPITQEIEKGAGYLEKELGLEPAPPAPNPVQAMADSIQAQKAEVLAAQKAASDKTAAYNANMAALRAALTGGASPAAPAPAASQVGQAAAE